MNTAVRQHYRRRGKTPPPPQSGMLNFSVWSSNMGRRRKPRLAAGIALGGHNLLSSAEFAWSCARPGLGWKSCQGRDAKLCSLCGHSIALPIPRTASLLTSLHWRSMDGETTVARLIDGWFAAFRREVAPWPPTSWPSSSPLGYQFRMSPGEQVPKSIAIGDPEESSGGWPRRSWCSPGSRGPTLLNSARIGLRLFGIKRQASRAGPFTR